MDIGAQKSRKHIHENNRTRGISRGIFHVIQCVLLGANMKDLCLALMNAFIKIDTSNVLGSPRLISPCTIWKKGGHFR